MELGTWNLQPGSQEAMGEKMEEWSLSISFFLYKMGITQLLCVLENG